MLIGRIRRLNRSPRGHTVFEVRKMRYFGWRSLLLAAALMTAAAVLFLAGLAEPGGNKAVSAQYWLIDHGGRVAVCPLTSGEQRHSTPIRVELLPSADQAELQNGIPAADAAALARLLEDLGC